MKGPSGLAKNSTGPNVPSSSGVREQAREIYPIFLRLRDRRVLVVGGGEIAMQRVQRLLATGAKITLIALQVKPELEQLAKTGQLQLVHREFERGDVDGGYFLVIGATNHPPTQAALWEEAEKLGLLCNVVDVPQHCNYFTPAVVERGDLKIAIGSAGQSPVLAGRLRQALEEALPPETDKWVEVLGELRRELKKIFPHDMRKRKQLLDEFIAKASQPE